MKTTEIISKVKSLASTLKGISLNKFNNTPIVSSNATNLIKFSVLNTQKHGKNPIDIKLVTPSGNGTSVVVLQSQDNIIPLTDKYLFNDSFGYIVMVPDVMFDDKTSIETVVSMLYAIFSRYISTMESAELYTFISSEGFLDDECNTYEKGLNLLSLYMAYDIINDWFKCDSEKELNEYFATGISLPNIAMPGYWEVDNAATVTAIISKMYSDVKNPSGANTETSTWNGIFCDCGFVKYL